LLIDAISDIHLDKLRRDQVRDLAYSFNSVNKKAIFLAGDIGNWDLKDHICIEFLKILSDKYENIYLTLGNHDYWVTGYVTPEAINEKVRRMNIPNVHFVEPGACFELGIYEIIGGPLFYQARGHPMRGMYIDYIRIVDAERFMQEQSELFKEKVLSKMNEYSIVLSHMLPSFKSVAPKYTGFTTNSFFVNDCEDEILEKQPTLWLHGHTHVPFDYKIGKTRIYCNPLGYEREGENPDFLERMAIEL
jgi:predicted MPP superfamily phosphohydrolase